MKFDQRAWSRDMRGGSFRIAITPAEEYLILVADEEGRKSLLTLEMKKDHLRTFSFFSENRLHLVFHGPQHGILHRAVAPGLHVRCGGVFGVEGLLFEMDEGEFFGQRDVPVVVKTWVAEPPGCLLTASRRCRE